METRTGWRDHRGGPAALSRQPSGGQLPNQEIRRFGERDIERFGPVRVTGVRPMDLPAWLAVILGIPALIVACIQEHTVGRYVARSALLITLGLLVVSAFRLLKKAPRVAVRAPKA